MYQITANDKVGEVARIRPQTMRVFSRYKLDLCCGAAYTLATVAEKHKLDIRQLLKELNEAQEDNQ
jgi:iron-sulfur cluster repair protein YtfE (RIC family)